ncbi:MAG: flavin reductase family protein [Desulfobacteraceae bacterium]|jgi:flavin reductase (DIM6/NTAB) family NADH-FMN oxidoreductase RutF|nr:MAG: flavin reductase family protein [Desulfobacteraceae bacterium]
MILKTFMREGIMPLSVALISTLSKDGGVRNIAPYSCIMPILRPLDLICIASATRRDTLINIRETKEFVVNMVGVDFSDKIVPTAKVAPPEVDEFEVAGLGEKRSETIRAPGIAGSYAWMECTLFKEYAEPDFVLILGKVLRLEVADEVLNAAGELNVAKAQPLMMIGSKKGMHFCTLKDIGMFYSFGSMFREGKDPLADRYLEKE